MKPDTASHDFERRLPLPPARLWEVLTDARHREQWGAPTEGTVLEVIEADTREGGLDRHRCGPAEAPEFIVDTRWYRLDAPNVAVFTETVEMGGELIFTSLVTYSLTASGSGTDLGVTVALSSFVGPDAAQHTRIGWEGGLSNLERYAAHLASEHMT